MKAVIALIVQACVFLVLFLVGSLADPFHLKWFATRVSATATRFFVPDGLILMCGAYVLLLLAEVASRRLERAGVWTTVAFVIALICGFLAKFGMITHDI